MNQIINSGSITYEDLLSRELDRSLLVAEVSSQREGVDYWTVLRVYYDDSLNQPYIGEIVGATSDPKGKEYVRRSNGKSIQSILKRFDPGQLSDELVVKCNAWKDQVAAQRREANLAIQSSVLSDADQFQTKAGVGGAMAWLYPDPSLSGNNRVERFASDFGIPARTVRHTLQSEGSGQPLTGWVKAFLRALRHFDRATMYQEKTGITAPVEDEA
jgi:hypothetical protein